MSFLNYPILQILLGLTPGELLTFGILGVPAWVWWRWILRNHRIPPAIDKS
jgi:hypothetical protein